MEIRRSYDRLISTMGFPIPVRWHLYNESGPRLSAATVLTLCKINVYTRFPRGGESIAHTPSRSVWTIEKKKAWWRNQMETFPCHWPFVRGIHRSPVNSPHKGLWRGALMFSLICAWTNGWVNNLVAGDLRRHRAHYDVIVMANRWVCARKTW